MHHAYLFTSQNIKEGIEGRPASWYSEVFDLIFPELDKEKANKRRVSGDEKASDESSDKDEKSDDSE
jgi:Lon-like ATP-dependent protease